MHLLTLKCGSPLDDVLSRDEMKLAERIASILQDFELRQLKIDEVKKLEVVEEEDQEFQPEEDCAGVPTPLTSEGTITFSEDRSFRRKTRLAILELLYYTGLRTGESGLFRDSMLGLQREYYWQEL
ncbi:unnamed protein product [Heligmosomoides polygyrus]|uniref:Tyr recombinase domain-containing protein n=1 Tax=Heligmosomoides polygyrus TaxID=6339 RepID=A0A183FUK5_HELPZ|nr:unnamed protein product [Heligmosomoides polygyrus]